MSSRAWPGLYTRRLTTAVCASAAVAIAISSYRSVGAQQIGPLAYPLRWSPDRLERLIEAHDRGLSYVPGEVLVKFKPGMAAAQQTRALRALRSRPAASALRWHGEYAELHDATEHDATILAAQLREQPEVQYAAPNYIRHRSSAPNDTSFTSLQWNFQILDLPKAWDINPGATSSVVVAIVDTGITTTTQNFTLPTWNGTAIQNFNARFAVSPDISPSRLLPGIDLVFWTGPVLDTDSHGTHVGSTVGETANNQLAEAGIAYNARLMPVKACYSYWDIQILMSANNMTGYNTIDGGCLDSDIADGVRFAADNGANVVNISLGGADPAPEILDALKYAIGKGVFIAMAGGNEFEDGNPLEYPAAYGPDLDGAITVGAVGPQLKRAFYSNTGKQIEIAAPGGDSRAGSANTAGIWQTTIFQPDFDASSVIFPRFDRYAETPFQGTSMATPHVAGIAALIVSQGVKNPAAIEGLIKATAKDLGATGRDDEFGFGLIQPRLALRGLGVAK